MKISKQLLLFASLLAALSTAYATAAPQAKKATGAHKPAASAGKAAPAQAASGGSSAAFNTYATQLRGKMGNNWQPPEGKHHVTLTIQVAQDGSVSNLTLASSPKSNEAEQKANDAFNSAQPLQALPSGCSGATISAVFDSQADQWDHKASISVKIDPAKSAPAESGDKAADSADSDKK